MQKIFNNYKENKDKKTNLKQNLPSHKCILLNYRRNQLCPISSVCVCVCVCVQVCVCMCVSIPLPSPWCTHQHHLCFGELSKQCKQHFAQWTYKTNTSSNTKMQQNAVLPLTITWLASKDNSVSCPALHGYRVITFLKHPFIQSHMHIFPLFLLLSFFQTSQHHTYYTV